MKSTQMSLNFPLETVQAACLLPTVSIDSYFHEKEANQLAEIESFNKHLFRPNTYLHKWWARRSGTTFRHILKQLVPEIEKQNYYTSGGLEGITVLDPMMGGGTILHEAIRLGANIVGYDVDPIPVLQARASLSKIPLYEKEKIYNVFESELSNRISKYFKTKCPICNKHSEIQFTLYGIRKKQGSSEILVVDSFILREETNDTQKLLDEFYPSRTLDLNGNTWKIIDKDNARKNGINGKNSDLITIPFCERYIPMVIIGFCEVHKTFFKRVDKNDHDLILSAKQWVEKNIAFSANNFKIPEGPKSKDLLNRQITHFYELFFPRQLIYIANSQVLLRTIPREHLLWMSLLISTSLEFNSALCGYKGSEKRRPGAIRHVFSYHAYSFPYTSLENNPLFQRKTSGTLSNLYSTRISAAYEWAISPIERKLIGKHWKKISVPNEIDMGENCSSIEHFTDKSRYYHVKQNDSSKMPLPSHSIDFVVTDPPYFDNVQYSDLSHFFRCWLKTFLPDEANWEYLAHSSAVAETNEKNNKFGLILGSIWKECNRVLKRPHGRLIFTYHHWSPNAWAQLCITLKNANFSLTNTYVVHSENPISVHIMNLHALKHDAILVLKPKDIEEKTRWYEQKPNSCSDSYSFCKACGQMTGWILDQSLSDEDISKAWSYFLKG